MPRNKNCVKKIITTEDIIRIITREGSTRSQKTKRNPSKKNASE